MQIETYIKDHPGTVAFWAIALVLLTVFLIRSGGGIVRFFRESWVELEKCSWPWDPQQKGVAKYKELIDSTVVVVISSILLAAYVTSADFLLMKVIGFLTRFHF